MKRAMIVLVAAGLLLGQTACSSTKAPTKEAPTGPVTMVEVKDFAFTPQTVTIAVGATVTWKFDDVGDHNVTAGDASFKSRDLSGGLTYTHTFTKAGTYPYICSIHPLMTGIVTVQ